MNHEISRRTEVEAPTLYERGLSLREVAKGALMRFLPASFVSMAGLAATMKLSVGSGLLAVTGSLGFAAAMTVGFGAGLLVMRPWLYPDSDVSGRRSVVAGLLSPLALFISLVFSSGLSPIAAFGALFLVGFLLALGLFFAWLTPTPGEALADAYSMDPEERESVASGSAR